MKKNYNRRDFLGNIVKAGSAGLILAPALPDAAAGKSLTVSDIIALILKEAAAGQLTETVDTIKAGSGDQPVTGIVTTMFATTSVIGEAVRRNANFIIAHEPTFYNHTDNINWVAGSRIVKQKQELLEKNGIAVWRFHDHWHRMHPDGILHGVLRKTGWAQYAGDQADFRIPPQPLGDIVNHLKQALGIPHLRVIGDLSASCSRISLMPGAAGGQHQMSAAEHFDSDLLIVGESSEWETPEYIRDARSFGRAVSFIVLGHAFSEEPGMEWLAEWLQPKVPELPVSHVASGEAFQWI
jgi:putative NIF3 family GTP cyclohydrolase 1 type 2